jgi:predicted aconitase with swiveling domain
MTPGRPVLRGPAGYGADVEGELLLSRDPFSIRYDMDRETGVICRKGHALEGQSLAGRIVYFPAVQGGVAAGWAFRELVRRGHAPAGVLFGRTNPVMVQGLVFAGIPVLHRLRPDPLGTLRSGDRVRMRPQRGVIELLAGAPGGAAAGSGPGRAGSRGAGEARRRDPGRARRRAPVPARRRRAPEQPRRQGRGQKAAPRRPGASR